MFAVPFLCFLVLFWKSGFSEPLVSQPPVCQSHLWRSCTPSTLNEHAGSQHEAGYNGLKKLSNTPAPHISLTVQYPFMADSGADPLPGDENSKAKAKVFKVTGRPQGTVAKCQICQSSTPQLCEKTEEKPWKIGKRHEEQVPFTLMYGDCLATVHQLTMSPRCLIKLLNQLAWQDCIAGWVVWTFCQSKSQSETRGMPKIWGPKPAPMSPKPWSVNLSGSTKLRPSFWSPEMQHKPRSLPGGLAFHWDIYEKSSNPGPPPLLWLPNYQPLHNCEDPPSKRSSEQAWKMPTSFKIFKFSRCHCGTFKKPLEPKLVCTWHFQPAMWSFGSSPRTPGLRLEGYAATCSTCRWD